jgi:hypothetical protein
VRFETTLKKPLDKCICLRERARDPAPQAA